MTDNKRPLFTAEDFKEHRGECHGCVGDIGHEQAASVANARLAPLAEALAVAVEALDTVKGNGLSWDSKIADKALARIEEILKGEK